MKNLTIYKSDIDKFWNKTKIIDECLIWQGATDGRTDGYGRFWINGRYVPTHRFAFYISNKFNIIEDLCICHTCDTSLCINPNHLFQGSYLDNNLDRNQKNRQAQGISCQQTILTEDQVREILIDIYNDKYQNIEQIQNKYFVGRSVISDILIGRSWKNITNQLQVPLNTIKDKVISNITRRSRTTPEIANEIRQKYASGISEFQLAVEYGIHKRQVINIIQQKSFK